MHLFPGENRKTYVFIELVVVVVDWLSILLNYGRAVCEKSQDARLYHGSELCSTIFASRHQILANCLRHVCLRASIPCLSEVACSPGSDLVPADVFLEAGQEGSLWR